MGEKQNVNATVTVSSREISDCLDFIFVLQNVSNTNPSIVCFYLLYNKIKYFLKKI